MKRFPLLLLLLVSTVCAGEKASLHVEGIVKSNEPGWSQWRGAYRDGISDETGLLQSWPENGPKKLWSASELGRGFSSPVLTKDRLYITGDVDGKLIIFCFDHRGKVIWKASNGKPWTRNYKGARACCLLRGGLLYNMNGFGRVVCMKPDDGSEVWAVDLLERFDGKRITWGHSECLMADGNRLIVAPGGRKGLVAALELKTGKTVWASESISGETSSYTSPILFEYGGVRHIVTCSSRHAIGINADTGKLLWRQPRETRYKAISSTPTYCGNGRVFLASPDGRKSELMQLTVAGSAVRARSMWQCDMNNLTGGSILLDGHLYGAGYRAGDGWFCIELNTGKTKFHNTDLHAGSMVYADGRLYCFSERGEMALMEPTPGGFIQHGRFRLVGGGEKGVRDSWAHPVVFDGRMYLRYHDVLYCYNIRK